MVIVNVTIPFETSLAHRNDRSEKLTLDHPVDMLRLTKNKIWLRALCQVSFCIALIG